MIRALLCKAFNSECKKCKKNIGHFTEACFKLRRNKNCEAKKAKVSVLTAETAASNTPAIVEAPAGIQTIMLAVVILVCEFYHRYSSSEVLGKN